MPFFSVIIPVYNTAQYLRQCLDSILGQDFADLEVLLVYDTSTDNSAAICEEYAQKDKRVQMICREKKEGLGAARNTGLLAARGEWILFVDSDDMWCPGALLQIYADMQQYKGQKIYVTRWQKFHDGQDSKNAKIQGNYEPGIKRFSFLQEKILFYGDHCGWAVWKLVLHRSLCCDVPLLFLPGVYRGEDVYWVTMLLKRIDEMCCLDTCLYRYRMRETGSLSELSAENCFLEVDSRLKTLNCLHSEVEDEWPFIVSWITNQNIRFLSLAARPGHDANWEQRKQKVLSWLPQADEQAFSRAAKAIYWAEKNMPGILSALFSLLRIYFLRIDS